MPVDPLVNPRAEVQIDVDGSGTPRNYRVDFKAGGYTERDLQYFAEKIQQGDFSYQGFLPESVWNRDDWSKGDGRVRWEAEFLGRCEKNLAPDIRFRRQITKGPLVQEATLPQAVSCIDVVTFEGNLYTAGGRFVFQSTDSGVTWTEVNDRGVGTTATGIHVSSDYLSTDGPILLIAYGDGTAYTYSNDGSTFTNSTRADDDAFATDFTTLQDRTWRLFSAADGEVLSVSNTTDPDNAGADWGGTVVLPNPDAGAHRIETFDNAILVIMEDGVHMVESDGTTRHLVDFSSETSSQNGQAVADHNGRLWFNILNRLFAYNGQFTVNQSSVRSFEPLGADQADWDDGDVDGTAVALMSAGGFLWAAVRATGGNYLIRCFNETAQVEAGVNGSGWTTYANVGTSVITGLGWAPPDANDNPRLLFSVGTTMRFIVMPARTLNPLADRSGNYRFSTSNDDLTLEDYDALLIDIPKGFLSIDLDVTNAANTSVLVRYSIDGGTIEALPPVTTSGTTVRVRFPTDAQGNRIQLIIRLGTTDNTQTPVVRAFVLRFELRPPRRMQWDIPLVMSSPALLPQFRGSLATHRANLLTARDSISTVVFKDLWGDSFNVYLDRILDFHPRQSQEAAGEDYEFIALVRIKEFEGSAGACYVDAADAVVGSVSCVVS